jgi:hypothetical protein
MSSRYPAARADLDKVARVLKEHENVADAAVLEVHSCIVAFMALKDPVAKTEKQPLPTRELLAVRPLY